MDKSKQQWVKEYDPATAKPYWYNVNDCTYSSVEPEGWDTDLSERNEQMEAAKKVQNLYRGNRGREVFRSKKLEAEQAQKDEWIKMYDPQTARDYYWNSKTAECVWEKPVEFTEGGVNNKAESAVRIQCAFRNNAASKMVEKRRKEKKRCDEENGASKIQSAHRRKAAKKRVNVLKEEKQKRKVAESSGAKTIQSAHRGKAARKHVENLRLEKLRREKVHGENIMKPSTTVEVDSPKMTTAFLVERTLQGVQREDVAQSLRTLLRIVEKFDIIWKMRPSIEIPTTLELIDNFHEDIRIAEGKRGDIFTVLEKRWTEKKGKAKLDSPSLQVLDGFCKTVRNLVDPLSTAATAMLDVERHRLQNAWSQLMALRLSEEVSGEGENAENFKKYQRQRIIDLKKLQKTVQTAQDKLRGVMQDGYEMGYINDEVLHGKRFFEWHKNETQPAIDAVLEVEAQIQRVRSQIAREIERKREERELVCMRQEEKRMQRKIRAEKEKLAKKREYEQFVASCRNSWEKGANRLDEEKRKKEKLEVQQQAAKVNLKKKIEEQQLAAQEAAENSCITPWEGVKVGCSVEKLESLISQEAARRRNQEGRDFHVDDPDHESNENLLSLVVWSGYLDIVCFLIERGANVNRINSSAIRSTPLHIAARAGHSDIVTVLIEAGADICAQESSGDTPLHWASRRGHKNVVDSIVMLPTETPTYNDSAIQKCVMTKNERGKLASHLTRSTSIHKQLQDLEEGYGTIYESDPSRYQPSPKASISKPRLSKLRT